MKRRWSSTTAADHDAKKTPAYDETRNTILPAASDDKNGLKVMLEAFNQAEHCARPGNSIPDVYGPKHDSFNMGLGCFYQPPDKNQPKKKRTGRTTRSGDDGRRHGRPLDSQGSPLSSISSTRTIATIRESSQVKF